MWSTNHRSNRSEHLYRPLAIAMQAAARRQVQRSFNASDGGRGREWKMEEELERGRGMQDTLKV